MNYLDFESFLHIKERNQQIKQEVEAIRLEERLREGHRQTSVRLITFALRVTLPLLGRVVPQER